MHNILILWGKNISYYVKSHESKKKIRKFPGLLFCPILGFHPLVSYDISVQIWITT